MRPTYLAKIGAFLRAVYTECALRCVSDSVHRELFAESVKARQLAYAPYSNFQVGAALLCDDGTIFTGCNVENSSYPLTTCAERTAVVKAVSEGHKNFVSIAVSAILKDNFVPPCGGCRQVLNEFDQDSKMAVYLVKPTTDEILTTTLENLLPLSFKF